MTLLLRSRFKIPILDRSGGAVLDALRISSTELTFHNLLRKRDHDSERTRVDTGFTSDAQLVIDLYRSIRIRPDRIDRTGLRAGRVLALEADDR